MLNTKKLVMGVAIGCLCSCTAGDLKRTVYETAAQEQCRREFENNPNAKPLSGSCVQERQLDGMTYEEYEKSRKQ